MDLDYRQSLRRLATRTLIVAERCDDRRAQTKLVEMANELIDMMGGHSRRESAAQQIKPH